MEEKRGETHDVGVFGYPVKPYSAGPSVFELAAEAQIRLNQRRESEEDGMLHMMAPDEWKDEEKIINRNNFLADPFHCDPDEYHPKGEK